MKITFRIDPMRMKLKDQIALEEGKLTYRQNRDMMARHMTGEDGEYLDFEAACTILDDLDGYQMGEAAKAFMSAIEGLRAELIPPA
jgi:hypothetical protein